jgi:hypothetical protein
MSLNRRMAGVRTFLFILGVGILLWVSLFAFGGLAHLPQYSVHLAHKLTARAMMSGTLRMDRGLLNVTMNDEQVYNGAGFTNWGFGVPLLQMPFHALAPLLPAANRSRFFPDRLIFFIYLVGLIPLLWSSLQRAIVTRTSAGPAPLSTWFLSWSATLFVLTYGLYALLSYRFLVYEETLAYFVVAQLYATSLYIRFLESKRTGWLCSVALVAGVGLLIRPTGLHFLVLWGALVFLNDRRWRTAVAFAGAAAPFVAFWLYSNWVKGGSPLTLGYQNALPEYPFHYAILRFGSQCTVTAHGKWQATKLLFESLFFRLPEPPQEMQSCHFMFEPRSLGNAPFFPPAVLLVLCGSLLYYLARRERRLDVYLPHVVFVMLFFPYAYWGVGFAWRYVGDFWPLVFLILVQLVPSIGLDRPRFVRYGVGLSLVLYSVVAIVQDVAPALPTIGTYDAAAMAKIDADVQSKSAILQPMLPSRLVCGEPLPLWPRANGRGWGSWPGQCDVDTITNVYLGVRKRADDYYKLRFRTDRPVAESLRVYVNGRYYTAHLEPGGEYVAELHLDYRKLYSPAVMVTVEWTHDLSAPRARLLEIEFA